MPPIELCLMIEGQEGVTWEQWRAIAAACERHGIATLFRSDHYMSGEHPDLGSLDAWATIVALATTTTKLRLGTLVSPVTFRHPSELARVAASADHVSQGRIELGLGAGWFEREHTTHGFAFPDLRTRMEMLEEQLQIVRGSWAPGPFSFNGRHYRVSELDALPKPVQQPRPPIVMGGDAGPRGCALAACYADEYNLISSELEEIEAGMARLHEACKRIGREPISVSVMTALVAGRDAEDLHRRAERVALGGWADAASLLSAAPAGWTVGVVDELVEQLSAWARAGVSRVMCQHLDHTDLEFIELLGSVLQPKMS